MRRPPPPRLADATVPPPLPAAEHSVVVQVDWARAARVPIDGLTCPGCGAPLHEVQDERGVLAAHTVRPSFLNRTQTRPPGPRAQARGFHRLGDDPFCPWDADQLTRWAHALALDLAGAAS